MATLKRAREIALRNGVRYAYTGNVHDSEGGSTYCHGCGGTLIGRDWYVLSEWNLTPEGCCKSCGTASAGVFEERPGAWGARRLPVRLGASRREPVSGGRGVDAMTKRPRAVSRDRFHLAVYVAPLPPLDELVRNKERRWLK